LARRQSRAQKTVRALNAEPVMDKPIDHERIRKVMQALKSFDLDDKEIALSILSNILAIHIHVDNKKSIVIEQQEAGGEPGFTVTNTGRGLQIHIPREALDPDLATPVN
jgi:hypothetical protein